jgi:hypothetical protein
MPDWGCFAISWTSYGIVIPLIEHVFGIQADAPHKMVVFDPHLPPGWENISIDELPVGNNLIAFSRAKSKKGIEYVVSARQPGWKFVVKRKDFPGAKYYVNGKPIRAPPSGIQLQGRQNHLLIVPGPASSPPSGSAQNSDGRR